MAARSAIHRSAGTSGSGRAALNTALIAPAALLAVAAMTTSAAAQTWIDIYGGSWQDAGNWNPSSVPHSGTDVLFNQSSGLITFAADAAARDARFITGESQFSL